MSSSAVAVDLRPLHIPATLDEPAAADFLEMTRIRNIVYRQISGHDDHAVSAAELLPHYRSDPCERRHIWLIVVGGRVVGRAGLDIPLEAGSRTAFWQIELLQDVWGRGAGSVAYARIEQVAREEGRTVLQSWAEQPAAAGPTLPSPTGFGSVPLDHAARFFLRHGYRLEQVERISALDLTGPAERIRRLLRDAELAASGYRIVQWAAPTPTEFVDGYAWMKSRMSTDAPAAGLEFDEEVWDAARIDRNDRRALDGGRTLFVTAAQHIATGALCAFNELSIGPDHTAASSQEDTLVVAGHRGHRLGMLVKCAGLLAWRERMPRSPRILTYNAEENRPMLDINEALGFEPIAYEGAWKKVLA